MLVGENIDEFSELLANCQSFLPQIYRIRINLPLLGHSPNFSPPKIQMAEFANVFHYTVISWQEKLWQCNVAKLPEFVLYGTYMHELHVSLSA